MRFERLQSVATSVVKSALLALPQEIRDEAAECRIEFCEMDALMDIAIDKWNQLLSVNLTGYLLCAQAFGRQMIAHGGGSMVHIASISASTRSGTSSSTSTMPRQRAMPTSRIASTMQALSRP